MPKFISMKDKYFSSKLQMMAETVPGMMPGTVTTRTKIRTILMRTKTGMMSRNIRRLILTRLWPGQSRKSGEKPREQQRKRHSRRKAVHLEMMAKAKM